MSPAQRKKSKPGGMTNLKRLYYLLGILTFIIFFSLFFVIGDYGLYQIYLLHKQKSALENNLVELKSEQDSLLVEKTRLETDLAYIEKIARERYRMARRGEKVFRVVEKQGNTN